VEVLCTHNDDVERFGGALRCSLSAIFYVPSKKEGVFALRFLWRVSFDVPAVLY
jgi:hypothetical protein